MSHLVGTLKIKKTYQKQLSHEVAAWRTEVEIEEGEYPLYVNFEAGRAYIATDNITATIIDNYTPSLYGGVRTGGKDGSEDIGNKLQQKIGVSRYMLEESDNFKVSLNPEFEKALKIGPSQGFDFDFESDFYKEVKKENEIASVHQEMASDYTVNLEMADKLGFLDNDKVRENIESGLTARSYVRAVSIDLMVRKYSGKSLDDLGVSMKDALEHTSGKYGELKSIVAKCAKEIMDENGLTPKEKESSQEFNA